MKDKPIQMRSSSTSKAQLSQFTCSITMGQDGIPSIDYNIGAFPKNHILPGLLAIASHVKVNLLDNFKQEEEIREHNDRAIGLIEHIANTQPDNSPVDDKVVTLPTQEKK